MSEENTVINYSLSDATIATLSTDFKDLECKGPGGYDSVKDARNIMRSHRLGVEEYRKEKNAPLLKAQRFLNDEAKRLQALIAPVESQLNAKLKVVDDEKKRIEAEKARIEQERIDNIKENINNNLKIDLFSFQNFDIEVMDECLHALENVELTLERYQEFLGDAEEARAVSIKSVNEIIANKLKKIEQERIAKEAADAATVAAKVVADAAEAQRLENKRVADEFAAEQAAAKKEQEAIAEVQRIKNEQVAAEQTERQRKLDVQQAELDAQKKAAEAPPEPVKTSADALATIATENNRAHDVGAVERSKPARIAVYTIQMDGDSWCATNESFINLQESSAGFGVSAVDALQELQDLE